MNEAFVDQRSLKQPIPLPHELLQQLHSHLSAAAAARQVQAQPGSAAAAAAASTTPAGAAAAAAASGVERPSSSIAWRRVYTGSSVSSICSSMSTRQLAHFFKESVMCIRSYDPLVGSVALRLPSYLAPALMPAPAAAGIV